MPKMNDLVALRKETQTPLIDCRNALEEAKGNLRKAKEILKRKGLTTLEKKKEREAKNGVIEAYVHNQKIGVILELNCETDFVARNSDFKEFAHQLAMQIASMNPKNNKELLEQNWIFDEKIKVKEKLHEVVLKIKENVQIKRFVRFELGEIC